MVKIWKKDRVIEDVYRVILLDNLEPSELLHSIHGARIKNASYLTQEEFLEHLKKTKQEELNY